MNIELVSFKRTISNYSKAGIKQQWNSIYGDVCNIIRNSSADLLVFCGATLLDDKELQNLRTYILGLVQNNELKNPSIVVILEVWNNSLKKVISPDPEIDVSKWKAELAEVQEVSGPDLDVDESDLIGNSIDERNLVKELHKITGLRNRVYKIEGGNITPLGHHQVMVTSKGATKRRVKALLAELDYRQFTCKGRNCLVLQCGEINVLKNVRNKGNVAEFRYNSEQAMMTKARSIYNDTDLFVNIIHTPMGRQWLMEERRKKLSGGKKVYVSTCNTDGISVQGKRLQYAYHSGAPLTANNVKIVPNQNYIVQSFSIP